MVTGRTLREVVAGLVAAGLSRADLVADTSGARLDIFVTYGVAGPVVGRIDPEPRDDAEYVSALRGVSASGWFL